MVKQNLYFHNGGFYAMPHFVGAIVELSKNPTDIGLYYGNSAGASWALVCYLVINGYATIEKVRLDMERVLSESRPISRIITPIYFELLDRCRENWPDDLAQRVSGILNIGVSTRNGHRFINQFKTNADIYNALVCSGTIAGCSNYKSMIDGETCLDGGYTFNPSVLPLNTTIIMSKIRVPLSLTCPPVCIHPFLEERGRRNAKNGLDGELILHDCGKFTMDVWFLIHDLSEKDLTWGRHIERITRSLISK